MSDAPASKVRRMLPQLLPWALCGVFALVASAEAKPPSSSGKSKPTEKPKKERPPSVGDLPVTLARPGGDAAREWLSPKLYARGGATSKTRSGIEVINPDFRAGVDVRLRCYSDHGRKVLDERQTLRPGGRSKMHLGRGLSNNRTLSGYCHVRASKPVFATADQWRPNDGVDGPIETLIIPMWRAGE